MMTISLVDVAKYYSGAANQTQALQRLQQQMEASSPNLLADTSEFVRLWRNQVTVSAEFLISPEGVGPAKVGRTYGEIKQALGSAYTYENEPNFDIYFTVVAVSRGEISDFDTGRSIAFRIFYTDSEPLSDRTIITALVTQNPKYQTLQGVGPGTLVSKAVENYGKAILSFNSDNESREIIRFEHGPANFIFRPAALAHSLAGDYSGSPARNQGNAYQTGTFFENASLSQVGVQSKKA